jgi:large subunit ribosomal protein L9
MELILLENVKNLGQLGDQVKVKPGYARNYLLPNNKAVLVNADNLKYFDERKEELQKKEQLRIEQLEERAVKLSGIQIEIAALVSEEGKLYGSIGVNEISEALVTAGHDVRRNEILLPNGAIRDLGLYEVQLGLNNGEKQVTIGLNVVAKSKH